MRSADCRATRARCLCKCARVATAFASYVSAQAAPTMATNPSNDRRIAPSERRKRERKGRDTGQFDGTLRASSVGRGSPWPMSPFDGIFVKGRASRSARSTGGSE